MAFAGSVLIFNSCDFQYSICTELVPNKIFCTVGFFTTTLQINFFPCTLAVILAEPTRLAVTVPLLTLATEELLLVHFTECLQPDNFNFFVWFRFKDKLVSLIFGVSTVTVHFLVMVPMVAVMIAFPFFSAVILPLPEILATDGLEECQDIASVALLIFNFAVCPFNSKMDVLLIFMGFAAGGGATGCGVGCGAGSGLGI